MNNKSRSLQGRRYSAPERQRLLEDFKRSGLTQRAFAQKFGIGLSTLQLWLRQAASTPVTSRPEGFVEIPDAFSFPPQQAVGCYRIHLPTGVSLEIPVGSVCPELPGLLQHLRDL
jgi:hypothetical protein